MDNIQFWIYVIFAIIYFVAKNYKKGNKKSRQQPNQQTIGQEKTSAPQPQSFEELLEEITGRRKVQEPSQKEINTPNNTEEELDRYQQPKPWEEQERKIEEANDFEKEGRNRQFADEESKRVYQESIKRAEGANLEWAVDSKYANSKVLRETAEEKVASPFIADIREMLADSNETKKAIILSEILNRKY